MTNLVAPLLGLPVDKSAVNSLTRGLVGDTSFAVLPNVAPQTTFQLTLLFQVVYDAAFRSSAQANLKQDLSREAIQQPHVGHLRWRRDSLRVCFVLIWMACPRKGDIARYHSLQLVGSQGPTIPGSISPSGCCRTCLALSTAVHDGRIGPQDHLHGYVVDLVPACI